MAERLSLLIDTRTSGDAEVRRLEQVINQVMDKSDRAIQQVRDSATATREWAISLGLLAGSAKVFSEIAQGVTLVTQGYVKQRGELGTLVDGYRGLRLAVAATEGASALYFAGATLGAGLLIERLGALSNSYAKVIEQQSLAAARGGGSLLSQRTFAGAGSVAGQDLSFLSGFDPDEVRDYITELEKIPDPIDRAQRAVKLFGNDAERAYSLLGTGVARNIDQARDLASQIDGPTRVSLQRLRDTLKVLSDSNPFTVLLQSFRQFRDEAEQGIVVRVAAVLDAAGRLPGSDNFSGAEPSGDFFPGSSDRARPGPQLPTFNDFRRLLPEVLGSPRGVGGPPDLTTPAQRNRAGQIALGRTNSIEALQSQLSGARASGETLTKAVIEGGSLAQSASLDLIQNQKLIESLERRIEVIQELKRSEEEFANLKDSVTGDVRFGNLAPQARRQAEAGLRFGQEGVNLLVPLVKREQEQAFARGLAQARNQGADSLASGERDLSQDLATKTQLFQSSLSGSIRNDEQVIRNIERVVDSLEKIDQERLDRQVKLIELTAGPNGELGALRKIYELRLATSKNAEEAADAQIEFLQRAKQLEEQRRRDSRETDGRVFDALIGGGAGIRGFALSTGISTGRTLFQNANEEFRTGIGSRLTLPGQRNSSGELNTFGRFLSGTIFGDKGEEKQITAANIQMAAAQLQLKAAGGSASGISSITGALGLPGGVFEGASGSNPLIFSNNSSKGGLRSQIPVFNELGEIEGYSQGGLTGAGKVAAAGAVAGGAFGVYSGIRQGGLRGGLTAVGSAAGAAAVFAPEPVSKAVLTGIAIGAGLISAILPDPKRAREGRINSTLDNATYVSPSAMNYASTIYGDGFDYNKSGQIRPIIINQNIQAADAKSFMDRRSDIAEATRLAIQEASPLNDEIVALARRS